jgi:DNA mismatch endonuclease (patch repair protein)
MPAANAEFWATKLAETRRRDGRAVGELKEMGWEAITIWEHEIRPSVTGRALELADQIRRLRAGSASG